MATLEYLSPMLPPLSTALSLATALLAVPSPGWAASPIPVSAGFTGAAVPPAPGADELDYLDDGDGDGGPTGDGDPTGDAAPSEDGQGQNDESGDPRRPDRSQARVELGYSGTTYAPEVPWQSGLAISAAWQSKPLSNARRLSVFVGAGYELAAPFQTALRSETAGIALTPRVSRYPIHAFAGVHWSKRAFGVDGELHIISELDRVVATNFALGAVDPGTKGISRVDDTSFALGFSPRVRLHYRPIRHLSVQLGLGADIFALNKAFFVELQDPDTGAALGRETYLRPNVARFAMNLGLVLWL